MSENLKLALETSAERASVALGRGGAVVFESEVEAGGRQSGVLMGPVQEALARVGGAVIEVVVVGTGPGSYNGARVGIAAGQGVAMVHGCPAVGVCSLEALAAVQAGGACLALGDARRGTYFTIALREGRLSGSPELLEVEEFVARVRAGVEEGASLLTLEEVDRLPLPEDLAGRVVRVAPTAGRLLEAWEAKGEEEQAVLLARPPQPFYLREAHITKPGERGKAAGVVE